MRSIAPCNSAILLAGYGGTFDEHLAWASELYERRSRYVHSGEETLSDEFSEKARLACMCCFKSLLRLAKASIDGSEQNLNGWLVTLDFFAKGLLAKKHFPPEEFVKAFLA